MRQRAVRVVSEIWLKEACDGRDADGKQFTCSGLSVSRPALMPVRI